MVKAKKEGNKDASWAIDFIKSNPSVNGPLFRQTMKNTLEPVTAFTDFECLALIIELKLTQRQYKKLRKMTTMNQNPNATAMASAQLLNDGGHQFSPLKKHGSGHMSGGA